MKKTRNKNLIQALALIVILCTAAVVALLVIQGSRSHAENYFEEMRNSVNQVEDNGTPGDQNASAGQTGLPGHGKQDADTGLMADNGTADNGTAGNGTADNGTAGNGTAGNSTADNNTAGNGTADNRTTGQNATDRNTTGQRPAGKSPAGQNGAEGSDVPETDILEELGITIPEKNLNWEKLQEQNEDIYAWIYVPDTSVDYPVVQHPTDNDWYVDHNLDGSRGFPACIYTENYNSKDFTDVHTVIYGHNLKDKSMFSSLHNFEDKELFGEDHYIFIYTEEKVFVYRIFAAYDYSDEHLLLNYNLANEYVYEQYLKDIFKIKTTSRRVANIKDDVTVTSKDRILTLLTCTRDSNPAYRFLVVGVLLNP